MQKEKPCVSYNIHVFCVNESVICFPFSGLICPKLILCTILPCSFPLKLQCKRTDIHFLKQIYRYYDADPQPYLFTVLKGAIREVIYNLCLILKICYENHAINITVTQHNLQPHDYTHKYNCIPHESFI